MQIICIMINQLTCIRGLVLKFFAHFKILEKDDIVNYLEGPVKQMGFNRLTGQNNNEKKMY